MSKKKNKLPPPKCILSFGEKLTQSKFSGKVSGVNLINGIIHLIRDASSLTGVNPKAILATVAGAFDYKITFVGEPNKTIRASESEKTAKEDDTEEHA